MAPESGVYHPRPEDLLTEDEYQLLKRAQERELPCPRCELPLQGSFYFVVLRGWQHKGVRLSCTGCGFDRWEVGGKPVEARGGVWYDLTREVPLPSSGVYRKKVLHISTKTITKSFSKLGRGERRSIGEQIMAWGNLVFIGLVITQAIQGSGFDINLAYIGVACMVVAYLIGFLIMKPKGGDS